jgi:L-alanine-DL-glutamate epimerase-like enolase superfamily enzyme
MIDTRYDQPLPIEQLRARTFTIATDAPEADGTLHWDSTTILVVSVRAGGCQGIGYSYTHHCAAALINDKLAQILPGMDALDTAAAWHHMAEQTRNLGRPGIVSTAIAAVDIALWDLKAKLLDLSLVRLLGAVRQGGGQGAVVRRGERRRIDERDAHRERFRGYPGG